MRVWEVAGALQDQSKQEREGCDPTQQGLGLVVLDNSKGFIPLVMDSGLLQDFPASVMQPCGKP